MLKKILIDYIWRSKLIRWAMLMLFNYRIAKVGASV